MLKIDIDYQIYYLYTGDRAMDDVFNIENFNIIQDSDNYYFFRALNMADNADIDGNITTDENGNITRIRTDRERWEETHTERAPRYNKEVELSLRQINDHIKMRQQRNKLYLFIKQCECFNCIW